MNHVESLVSSFSSLAWGFPLLILLIGGGLYLIWRSRFLPFRYLSHAIQVLRGKYDDPHDPGEISHFKALATALSSTIGMGNIAGVAVAISIGGPGAIFWMWISGIIGMNTKFFTCTLAIMFRGKDSAGNLQGGPMYFIQNGLGKRWKPMAVFFSIAGLIGALPVFNVNQLTQALRDIILKPNGLYHGFISDLGIGIILVTLASIVILGGLKRISHAASRLVPAMVIVYFISVMVILALNYDLVPYYFKLIFTEAFSPQYFKGEPLLGGLAGGLILLGIRRGAFSNEAGIGMAPMAHGAAKTKEPVREGMVAMLGPFIDTVIVCTLTALAILVTGVWETTSDNGVSLTANAFEASMPLVGKYILLLCIAAFSISSLFTFSYYGTKCLSYLLGDHRKHWYNYFYLLSILIGATTTLDLMINLIDGFYALMAFPTMIATLMLSRHVIRLTRDYFDRLNNSSFD